MQTSNPFQFYGRFMDSLTGKILQGHFSTFTINENAQIWREIMYMNELWGAMATI